MDQEIIGAALFAAGLATGTVAGRLRRKPAPVVVESGPRCGCEHLLSEHAEDGGECLAEVQRRHYHRNGDWNGHEWVTCSCRIYIGPEPLPQVWVPRAGT